MAVCRLSLEPLPQGEGLTLVFGAFRLPLPGKFRPSPCCIPQVSEGPCLCLGGALGASL